MLKKNDILILCKVVDNYGDIGVVYRLARAISDLRPALNLTLVVSNLESFHSLASNIDPEKAVQKFNYKNSVWNIIDWNVAPSDFTPPDLILECFQCGRPDWLEDILFAPDYDNEVQILNIDYLTAEEYADEFHLLKSGTRKTNIKKRFFMPGFTEKTAGLIINGEVKSSLEEKKINSDDFNIFFFAYDFDCSPLVQGITEFQKQMKEIHGEFSVNVFLAAGKSLNPFVKAWEISGKPFKIHPLPFLQQEEFDSFILKMDFLFVRGEDSLARAALTSIPFIWQAYIQDENYQLVKVNALLERMKSQFDEKYFETVCKAWQNYNDCNEKINSQLISKLLLESSKKENSRNFDEFAKSLYKNGNLASHLLDYIDSL